MAISSAPRQSAPRQGRRPGAALLLLAGAALGFAAASAGCARLAARPPELPDPQRTVASAGIGAPAASAGSTVAPGSAAPTPSPFERSPIRDPSEEITPEELAAISEPVPVPGGVSPWVDARTPPRGLQKGSQGGSIRAESVRRQPSFLWRVQIFVTQDRDLADRKAREAFERLQVRAHVAYKPPYYKVRLGDYTSEAEAQSLRQKALFSGYPGAFRVRCFSSTTSRTD